MEIYTKSLGKKEDFRKSLEMKNTHSILIHQFLSCYNFKWGWSNLVSPQETELNVIDNLLRYKYVKNIMGLLFYLFYSI